MSIDSKNLKRKAETSVVPNKKVVKNQVKTVHPVPFLGMRPGMFSLVQLQDLKTGVELQLWSFASEKQYIIQKKQVTGVLASHKVRKLVTASMSSEEKKLILQEAKKCYGLDLVPANFFVINHDLIQGLLSTNGYENIGKALADYVWWK